MATAIPYPPTVTEKPAPHKSLPVFGNKYGNFQPENITAVETKPSKRATGGWVQIAADAVWSINDEDGIGAGSDSYTMYWGDGGSWSGWPTRANWVSFTEMYVCLDWILSLVSYSRLADSLRFNNNKGLMFQSCSQFGQPDDSGPEVGAIWDAIESVAQATGVDHRFILAVIMQESGGCVRVPTTNYGVRNPGLMQDHNGSGTCNSDITGQVQNPCPSSVIHQMIADGTGGTNDGDGLAQCISESGWGNDADFYRAARIYNSGSIASSGQLQDGIATHCYASDIANRLTGWVWAAHGCTLDG